jgi:hypothetical protein
VGHWRIPQKAQRIRHGGARPSQCWPHELLTKLVYSGFNEVNLAQPGGVLTPNAYGPAGAPPNVRY